MGRREWIEWTPNVVSVRAAVKGSVVAVRLASNTPYFKRYEMRAPGGPWNRTEDAFDLPLAGARFEREFHAVNQADVAGPVSRLAMERE